MVSRFKQCACIGSQRSLIQGIYCGVVGKLVGGRMTVQNRLVSGNVAGGNPCPPNNPPLPRPTLLNLHHQAFLHTIACQPSSPDCAVLASFRESASAVAERGVQDSTCGCACAEMLKMLEVKSYSALHALLDVKKRAHHVVEPLRKAEKQAGAL